MGNRSELVLASSPNKEVLLVDKPSIPKNGAGIPLINFDEDVFKSTILKRKCYRSKRSSKIPKKFIESSNIDSAYLNKENKKLMATKLLRLAPFTKKDDPDSILRLLSLAFCVKINEGSILPEEKKMSIENMTEELQKIDFKRLGGRKFTPTVLVVEDHLQKLTYFLCSSNSWYRIIANHQDKVYRVDKVLVQSVFSYMEHNWIQKYCYLYNYNSSTTDQTIPNNIEVNKTKSKNTNSNSTSLQKNSITLSSLATDSSNMKKSVYPKILPHNVIFQVNEPTIKAWYSLILGVDAQQANELYDNENKIGLQTISDIIKCDDIDNDNIRNINQNITVRSLTRLKEFRRSVSSGNRRQLREYINAEKSHGIAILSNYYKFGGGNCDDLNYSTKSITEINRIPQIQTSVPVRNITQGRQHVWPCSTPKVSRPAQNNDIMIDLVENLTNLSIVANNEERSNQMNPVIADQLQTANNNENLVSDKSTDKHLNGQSDKDLSSSDDEDNQFGPTHRYQILNKANIRERNRQQDVTQCEIPPPCSRGTCRKSCNLINRNVIDRIFNEFWQNPNNEAQQNWIVEKFIFNKTIMINELVVCANFLSSVLGQLPDEKTGFRRAVGANKIKELQKDGYAAIKLRGGSVPDLEKLNGIKVYKDQTKKMYSHYKRLEESRVLIRIKKPHAQSNDGNYKAYLEYCNTSGKIFYEKKQFQKIWDRLYLHRFSLKFDRSSHCEFCVTFENTINPSAETIREHQIHVNLVSQNKEQRYQLIKSHDNTVVSFDLQKQLFLYDNVKCEGTKLNYLGNRPVLSNNTYCKVIYNPGAKDYGPNEYTDKSYEALAVTYVTPHRRTAHTNINTLITYIKLKKLKGRILFEADNAKSQSKAYEFYEELFGWLQTEEAEGIDSITVHYGLGS